MFFSEKIISIKPTDKVLEIGPGGTPHPRSDVFLEKPFDSKDEKAFQRGYAPELKTDKPVIFFNGGTFPFQDKEFDYVICSHVLEHVEDIDEFVSELKRVGKMGYIEYPMIYYDYLYNFDVHLTFLKRNKAQLIWMSKNKSCLYDFKPVQEFFYKSLENQYVKFIDDHKTYFFEGWEWNQSLTTMKTQDLGLLCHHKINYKHPTVAAKSFSPNTEKGLKERLKLKFISLIKKL